MNHQCDREQIDGDRHQRRNDRRAEQVENERLRDDAIEDHHDRRRDQRLERAAGRDRAGRERRRIAALEHFGKCRAREHGSCRGRRSTDDAEGGAAADGRIGQVRRGGDQGTRRRRCRYRSRSRRRWRRFPSAETAARWRDPHWRARRYGSLTSKVTAGPQPDCSAKPTTPTMIIAKPIGTCSNISANSAPNAQAADLEWLPMALVASSALARAGAAPNRWPTSSATTTHCTAVAIHRITPEAYQNGAAGIFST